MKHLIPRTYLEVLKQKDFLKLILMIMLGQLATAFLLLSLIVSVYLQTQSSFGISGVILSFTIPALFLMAFAGLAADIFDRRKVMIGAYILIALVVVLILISVQTVAAAIPLSFLYFAGNTFFIPASSAATAQLVKKNQLLTANSIFVFTLSSALLFGFFLASVVHFFFTSIITLFICLILLISAIIIGMFLPQLQPSKVENPTLVKKIQSMIGGFKIIMTSKIVWFFFLMFALIQGIILFGVTLAPGFFTDIVGITIDKSPILILPLIGIGVLIGVGFVHRPDISEGFLVALGLSLIGVSSSILGALLFFDLILGSLFFYIMVYLIIIGFGAIITLIASRTVIQKEVPQSNMGLVFGANMILTSLFASFMSPAAALLEVLFGYFNILIYGGLVFLTISAVYAHFGSRWKF